MKISSSLKKEVDRLRLPKGIQSAGVFCYVDGWSSSSSRNQSQRQPEPNFAMCFWDCNLLLQSRSMQMDGLMVPWWRMAEGGAVWHVPNVFSITRLQIEHTVVVGWWKKPLIFNWSLLKIYCRFCFIGIWLSWVWLYGHQFKSVGQLSLTTTVGDLSIGKSLWSSAEVTTAAAAARVAVSGWQKSDCLSMDEHWFSPESEEDQLFDWETDIHLYFI